MQSRIMGIKAMLNQQHLDGMAVFGEIVNCYKSFKLPEKSYSHKMPGFILCPEELKLTINLLPRLHSCLAC